jgi:hypothetical protein
LARQRSILAANASSKSIRGNAGSDRAKNKVARRSLDNSQLPSLSNIDIANPGESSKALSGGATSQTQSLPQLQGLGSPSSKIIPEKLLLDPMERRRQAKAEREAAAGDTGPTSAKLNKIGKALSRRSFGGETELELAKFQAALAPQGVTTLDVDMPVLQAPARPPSLLESYSSKGGAFISIPNIDTSEAGKGPRLLESKSVPRRARA